MKKEVLLVVLRTIEPYLPKFKANGLVAERKPDVILRIVDVEGEGGFLFEVVAVDVDAKGQNRLKLKAKPMSQYHSNVTESIIDAKSFEDNFKYWFTLVESYNTIKSVYDDPILKKYEDDFYAEFISADDDANIASFNLKQQLLLDSALSQVIQVLESKKDETNEEVISELIEQAEEIQNTVTENTKQETLTKMSKLFAKVQKGSIKWIKDIYPIFEKEIIGAIAKGAVAAAGAAAAAHLLNP